MTMLEAIRAARIAFNKLYVSCNCEADKEYDAGVADFGAAESEAKRGQEEFERAREAWGVRSHGLITMTVADACDLLDAYFATGEKEG